MVNPHPNPDTFIMNLRNHLERNENSLYQSELYDYLEKYRRTFFGYLIDEARKNPSVLNQKYFATIWRDIAGELESKKYDDAARKVYITYVELKKNIITTTLENTLSAIIFGLGSTLTVGNVILGNKLCQKFENYIDNRNFNLGKKNINKIALGLN